MLQSTDTQTCFLTGQGAADVTLLPCVVGMDGVLYPNLQGKLPGNAVYIPCSRGQIEAAVKDNVLYGAAGATVSVPEGCGGLLEKVLLTDALRWLSLARKSGELSYGFTKVQIALSRGNAGVLVTAADAAEDGVRQLTRVSDAVHIGCFSRESLAQIIQRDNAVYLAVKSGTLATNFIQAAQRYMHFINSNAAGETNTDFKEEGYHG